MTTAYGVNPVDGWWAGGPAPVAVALDAPDLDTARRWAAAVERYAQVVKIGLEMFCHHGPDAVTAVREVTSAALFLDLKLHDIPATVAGAARSVARLRPAYLTVHATGGAAMIRAAVEAAPEVAIAAVTVLTSMGPDDLAAVGLLGSSSDAVRRLATIGVSAGARAVVCSPHEVAAVRVEVGPGVTLITPGVRPAGTSAQDQARVSTPRQARDAGADLLVIGRPITAAADPGAAAAAIAESLAP